MAFRTTSVGTGARSAVRSETLPSSQRPGPRLPSEETTTIRQDLGFARLTSSSSGIPPRMDAWTTAPFPRRRAASASSSRSSGGWAGISLTWTRSSGACRSFASSQAASAACVEFVEKSVPQSTAGDFFSAVLAFMVFWGLRVERKKFDRDGRSCDRRVRPEPSHRRNSRGSPR